MEMNFFRDLFALTNSNDVSSWAGSKLQVEKFWPGWTHPEKNKNTGILPRYDVFSVMATKKNIPDIFLMFSTWCLLLANSKHPAETYHSSQSVDGHPVHRRLTCGK
jgi:hypothetical protein